MGITNARLQYGTYAQQIGHVSLLRIASRLTLLRANGSDTSETPAIRLAEFYLLPKLHKDPSKGALLSLHGLWVFTPLSQWIAFHLNTVLESCDTVLASTASIVTELRAFADPHDGGDVYLVTADLSGHVQQHPCRPSNLGCGFPCYWRRNFSPRLVAAITAALELVLNNNYFSFDGGHLPADRRHRDGTPCAPPLAQLFVAVLEEDLRASMNTRWPSLYKRFIDDSIAIFKGLRAELDSFLSRAASHAPKTSVGPLLCLRRLSLSSTLPSG